MRSEIGGYLELERFSGSMMHDNAFALNSGRAALAYLIRQRNIHRIALPDFICDAVTKVCRDISIVRYSIGPDLRPVNPSLDPDAWFYLVNYYGQLSKEEILEYASCFPRLIVDNAQAFFCPALPEIDTIYTCRKFIGVADGAFLYSDVPICPLPQDASHARMDFVLGRFECPAEQFYTSASKNNEELSAEPHIMSPLTQNLLRAVDYISIEKKRLENYLLLHEAFRSINALSLRIPEGPYAYPLLLPHGYAVRRKLIEKKIYVPVLWPNVLTEQPADSAAAYLAGNIVPLPCDQRYGNEEMSFIIRAVQACL